jgi:hypothetical protein
VERRRQGHLFYVDSFCRCLPRLSLLGSRVCLGNAITTNPDLETVFVNMHSAGIGVTLKKR